MEPRITYDPQRGGVAYRGLSRLEDLELSALAFLFAYARILLLISDSYHQAINPLKADWNGHRPPFWECNQKTAIRSCGWRFHGDSQDSATLFPLLFEKLSRLLLPGGWKLNLIVWLILQLIRVGIFPPIYLSKHLPDTCYLPGCSNKSWKKDRICSQEAYGHPSHIPPSGLISRFEVSPMHVTHLNRPSQTNRCSQISSVSWTDLLR